MGGRPRRRLSWFVRLGGLVLRDPVEGVDRVESWLLRVRPPASLPPPDDAWRERMHRLLSVPWPCSELDAFQELWPGVVEELRARGLVIGRDSYHGWDDADEAFASAVWCATVHTHADVVVETGVARGLTSRLVLEALHRRGAGHLWSIDRPPVDPVFRAEIGAAVPELLRRRWTLLEGTSRLLLPTVLARTEAVDVFVHDSRHTRRNVERELRAIWPRLAPGGVAVVDDVHLNDAFTSFVASEPQAVGIVAAHSDGAGLFGVLLRRLNPDLGPSQGASVPIALRRSRRIRRTSRSP